MACDADLSASLPQFVDIVRGVWICVGILNESAHSRGEVIVYASTRKMALAPQQLCTGANFAYYEHRRFGG